MAVNGKKTALLVFATLIAFAAGCGKSDWKDSSAIRIKLDVDSLLNGTSVSIDDIFQEIQLVPFTRDTTTTPSTESTFMFWTRNPSRYMPSTHTVNLSIPAAKKEEGQASSQWQPRFATMRI